MTEKYYGNVQSSDDASAYNELVFQINAIMKRVNTCMPVQVTAVKAGGLGPVGFVDVQVMVTQLTGNNTVVANPSIQNVPYFRVQGGKNAVIIDPQVGDIGVACFCQRDISSVKKVRAVAPPGSHRMFSFSDAVYFGGTLNGIPEQYIKFDGSGIAVYSPTKITCTAPEILMEAVNSITMDAPLVEITGSIGQTGEKGTGAKFTGGIENTGGTTSSNGIVVETHLHPGVEPGGSNTGTPI